MTTAELKAKLKALGVLKYYCINEDFIDGAYVLLQNADRSKWEYFLYEKGKRSHMRTFFSENEACEYVYNDAIYVKKLFDEKGINY